MSSSTFSSVDPKDLAASSAPESTTASKLAGSSSSSSVGTAGLPPGPAPPKTPTPASATSTSLDTAVSTGMDALRALGNVLINAAPQTTGGNNTVGLIQQIGLELNTAVPSTPVTPPPRSYSSSSSSSSARPTRPPGTLSIGGRRRSMHKKVKKARKSRKNKSM
jgi:hypothetical protein